VLTQELLVRMCRARAALEDVDADVTVAALAKASRLSRSQFIAKWLLATGNLTVTEICMAVGFSSLGSFSHQFRLRCGESPVQYRARLARGADTGSPAARLAPHCMPLMAAAWTKPSYFSRSVGADEPLESVR